MLGRYGQLKLQRKETKTTTEKAQASLGLRLLQRKETKTCLPKTAFLILSMLQRKETKELNYLKY